MSIGGNIKSLRERFGLTQQQLGEIAGVSDKAVSTWENDANVPRMGAIQKIADYFQIPKSDIIEGDLNTKKLTLEDELNKELIGLLVGLTPEEVAKVRAFVAGLKAARGASASRNR